MLLTQRLAQRLDRRAGADTGRISIAPAVATRRVGQVSVTALLDGSGDFGPDLVVGYEADMARDLRDHAYLASETITIPISAYLIEADGALLLVDTGLSDSRGPASGHLIDALARVGVRPDDIDAVLLTHLHPDHVNGLTRPDGSRAFNQAAVLVQEEEFAYWNDDAIVATMPDFRQANARAAFKKLAAYGDDVVLFGRTERLTNDIAAVALPGHTPGHTGFRLESAGETLLIWGDIVHLAAYQFARPDWGMVFDTDPLVAAETRRAILEAVAAEREMVAGMHLPFPGFGYVERRGAGFHFHAAEWQYGLEDRGSSS